MEGKGELAEPNTLPTISNRIGKASTQWIKLAHFQEPEKSQQWFEEGYEDQWTAGALIEITIGNERAW